MSTTARYALVFAGLLVVALAIVSNRQPVFVTTRSDATTPTTIQPAILTSGDATVSLKPDLAIITAGVDSQQSSASAAQADLAAKTSKLVARIKGLGVADKDVNTVGYWVGPVYAPSGQSVVGYRAAEQLQVKWHNVDTVGKTLDAIVQEGGATTISVGFTLSDPKAAQAEARSLAIADARSKAQAMASAASVKLGQVLRVSDLSTSGRFPTPVSLGAASSATQIPVGELDVQVTVEVDFAIA